MSGPKVSTDAAPAADLQAVRACVASLLLASKFHLRDLDRVVVVATHEERTVVLRAALAEELRRGDLPELAHECMARRVRPGEVLVYAAIEGDDEPSVGFVVVSLLQCGRRRRR